MTCQQNRLPSGVDDCFLHKEKTVPGNKYARVASFNKPIALVIKKTKKAQLQVITEGEEGNVGPTEDVTWTRVHVNVTFQLTSSTNISTVNALNKNQLFVQQKERGHGNTKHKWAIETNEARQLYLASYGVIDTIDLLIKRCNLYVSWKHWRSCKLHVQALGLVIAYDMYCEVVQEGFAAFGFENIDAAKNVCSISTRFATSCCCKVYNTHRRIVSTRVTGA
jgi:hypothetical protein